MSKLTKRLAAIFPNLELQLRQSQSKDTPSEFAKKSLIGAGLITVAILIALIFTLLKLQYNLLLLLCIIPLPIIFFLFLMNSPKVYSKKRINEIDSEIVFAGRFLLIEISAGIPLYDAIKNVSKAYPNIGKHFQMIINKVEVGNPLDKALSEVIDVTPSENFRKLVWQISNSLKTGGDIAIAIRSIISQISQEQLIDLENYGKKLNPIVMFYLIVAVIAPSLGVSMLTLLSSFIGLPLSFGILLAIAIGIGLMQLVFLTFIRSSRPGVGL